MLLLMGGCLAAAVVGQLRRERCSIMSAAVAAGYLSAMFAFWAIALRVLDKWVLPALARIRAAVAAATDGLPPSDLRRARPPCALDRSALHISEPAPKRRGEIQWSFRGKSSTEIQVCVHESPEDDRDVIAAKFVRQDCGIAVDATDENTRGTRERAAKEIIDAHVPVSRYQ